MIATETNIASLGPIQRLANSTGARGLDIRTTANLLRRYVCVERGMNRMLAGWFLAAPAYETKYAMGYHLFDHAEHVDWLRTRLEEMRGGNPDASVEPALAACVEETMHAPTCEAFVEAAYLELKRSLLDCYRDHLAACDASANAAEARLLRRMIADLERHVEWAEHFVGARLASPSSTDLERRATQASPLQGCHRARIGHLTAQAGGISGLEPRPTFEPPPLSPHRFRRPATILFDSRIRIGELMPYDQRQQSDDHTATIEQFKVFFNELYAAAVLASILHDASPAELPWEFFHDFSRHFWDEVRHSEFGATRLKELGAEPNVCNPILFERSQGLPILHRVAYLTMGLEVYFMPRKGEEVREYADRGDVRSQLFADQDWSDETTHVHFGKKWVKHLLEGDFRTPEDVMDEVREQLERMTGEKQSKIAAPF